jgi:copper homeostasis protein
LTLQRPYELEVIAFDAASCRIAQQAGADRIELCANPMDGGTTPSHGMIRVARTLASIQLFPIIRPRGGNFLYSAEEFEIMKQDVLHCKEVGCDGVVVGLLTSDGKVDVERTTKLVELAYPLGVTFHRAIDHSADMLEALKAIMQCGCERILTSGGMPTAPEGADMIGQLIKAADGSIDIMPGSGIRSTNIAALAKATGARVFHSSARTMTMPTESATPPHFHAEAVHATLDGEEVKRMISALETSFGKI